MFVDSGSLIIQLLIFGTWPFLSLIALLALRHSRITGTNQALWALLIVAVPVLGALAFFIVKPIENNQS
jgi:hypothetical protein